MTSKETHATFQVATHYAGSFLATLAQAGLYADPTNRQRLLVAFPEIERDYGPTSTFYKGMFPC